MVLNELLIERGRIKLPITLTDRQYNVLKWIISVVLPALIVFIGVVMQTLDYAHTDVFMTIAVALETFLGSIFKFAEYNYDKEVNNE